MSFPVKFNTQHIVAGVRNAAALLVLWALASCGGGQNVASLPGTGGTGITASGPVTGFGSVVVNGIRFDDASAEILIDGALVKTDQLRLGMVAKVVGSQSSAASSATPTTTGLGTANSIELWSASQGMVSSIQSPSTVTVAGMTLVVNPGTVFDGAESLASLNPSSVIKVWGQPSSTDFKQWAITRLEVLKAPQNTVSTGKVNVFGSKLVLNGMVLVNAPVGLVDGQLIRVMGTVSGTTELVLTAIQTTVLAEAGSTTASAGYTELQGIVTSILNTSTVLPDLVTRLTIGASVVDTSSASVLPLGAAITQGLRIQVQGQWNSGVLVASQVKAISVQELKEVDVEGLIEVFTGLADFTVRGQRFDASSLAREAGDRLGEISVGTRVHLIGVKKGNAAVVTSLEIK